MLCNKTLKFLPGDCSRFFKNHGGGYVFMSDHSVSSDVSGQTYDLIVKLVREYGQYPLELPEA